MCPIRLVHCMNQPDHRAPVPESMDSIIRESRTKVKTVGRRTGEIKKGAANGSQSCGSSALPIFRASPNCSQALPMLQINEQAVVITPSATTTKNAAGFR